MPRSERYFPTLTDVTREFLAPADWEKIFGQKSKERLNQKERHP